MATRMTVGARLSLAGRAQFVSDAEAADAAVGSLTRQFERLATAAEAAGGAVAASSERSAAAAGTSVEASKAATAATTETTVAGDAALLAAGKREKAIQKEAAAVRGASRASKEYAGVLAGFANNPAVRNMALFGGSAIALGAYEAVKAYNSFQKAMTQSVTLAGLPANQLQAAMKGALQVSSNTGQSALDVANAFYRISSANVGLHVTTKQLIGMTDAVSKLGVVLDTKGASFDTLSRIFGAINLAGKGNRLQGVGSVSQMMAMIAATVGAGDIRGPQMAGALGRGVLQSGQAVHAKLPDILAWIALGTRFAQNPSTAGTLIAHSLQQLAKPSEQGSKVEALVGIAPTDLAHIMQRQGISQALRYLYSHINAGLNVLPGFPTSTAYPTPQLAGEHILQSQLFATRPDLYNAFVSGKMSPSQQSDVRQMLLGMIFGGARQEIPILTAGENQQLMGGLVRYIENHSRPEDLNKIYQIARNTPAQQQQIALTQLKNTMIGLGKQITGYWTRALRFFAAIGGWFGNHPALAKEIAVALGGAVVFSTLAIAANKITKFLDPALKFFGFKGFSGRSAQTIQMDAATMQLRAAELQLAAAERGGLGGGGGLLGFGRTALQDGELAVGVGAASRSSLLKGTISRGLGRAVGALLIGTITDAISNSVLPHLGIKGSAAHNISTILGFGAAGLRLGGPMGGLAGLAVGTLRVGYAYIARAEQHAPLPPGWEKMTPSERHKRALQDYIYGGSGLTPPGGFVHHHAGRHHHTGSPLDPNHYANSIYGGIQGGGANAREFAADLRNAAENLKKAKEWLDPALTKGLTAKEAREAHLSPEDIKRNAKNHLDAANKQLQAAKAMEAAVKKLSTTQIQAVISGQQSYQNLMGTLRSKTARS